MNASKPVAILIATFITIVGMVAIANYSNAATDAARGTTEAPTPVMTTLPAIEVHPSPEQIRELRADPAAKAGAENTAGTALMPYYSFASDQASA